MLKYNIGNDLIYSLVLDHDDRYYILVSAHKSSEREFKDGKMQRILLSQTDNNKQDFVLVNEIYNIINNLLVKK